MTNYKKGARFEYEIYHLLKPNSILTTRTAGSHSAVDIISISQNTLRLIQAKTSVKTTLTDRLRKNPDLNIADIAKYDSDVLKLQKLPARHISISRELWIKEFRKPILKFKI